MSNTSKNEYVFIASYVRINKTGIEFMILCYYSWKLFIIWYDTWSVWLRTVSNPTDDFIAVHTAWDKVSLGLMIFK